MSHRFLGAVLLTFLAPLCLAADVTRLNQQIAEYYTAAVADAIDTETALEFVTRALEFNPDSGDALFLRAYLLRNNQDQTFQAVADLNAAIQADSFVSMSFGDAAVLLAEIQVRIGEWGAAVLLVESLDLSEPGIDADLRARADAVLVHAGMAQQDGELVSEVLERSRRDHPNDIRFLFFELLMEPVPSFRYRRELERFLALEHASEYGLRSLLRYAVTAPTMSERDWAIGEYLAHGGVNPAISLAAIGSSEFDAAELFTRFNGFSRRDVYQSLAGALPEETTSRLAAESTGFSGASVEDVNNDGFWESRVWVESGSVIRWEHDPGQDGRIDTAVSFLGDEPVSAEMLQDGSVLSVTYAEYPYVESVHESAGDGMREHVLEPYTVMVRVPERLAHGPFDLLSDITPGETKVDLRAVARAATRTVVRDSRGVVIESRDLSQGTLLRLYRDLNRDGEPDELVVFEDDLPSSALRDIDFDGYFEVAVAYENGIEVATLIDEDDNGQPETAEYAREGGVREWDLNQDGIIDVAEFGIWTEEIETEFPVLGRE